MSVKEELIAISKVFDAETGFPPARLREALAKDLSLEKCFLAYYQDILSFQMWAIEQRSEARHAMVEVAKAYAEEVGGNASILPRILDFDEMQGPGPDGINKAAVLAFTNDYGVKNTEHLLALVELEMPLEDYLESLSGVIECRHEDYFFWVHQFLLCFPWESRKISLHTQDWMDDQITRRETNAYAGGSLTEPTVFLASQRGRIYTHPPVNSSAEKRLKELRDRGVPIKRLMPEDEGREKQEKRLAALFPSQ